MPRVNPAILMYHRIADPPLDPWGLSVSPDVFRDQLEVLSKERQVLSMDAMVDHLLHGSLPKDAVAITFDDGYVDNLLVAKPLLEAAGIPATIFLSTASIGQTEEFWWDLLARMIVLLRGSMGCRFVISGQCIVIDLPALEENGAPRSDWRTDSEPQNARERTYLALWSALQRCRPEQREEHMSELQALFAPSMPSPNDFPMSQEQARRLPSDLISVGGHSRRHHPLTTFPPELRRLEIEGCRRDCARIAGVLPTGFAYPHGDRDADTITLVREAGYNWACSTQHRAINRLSFDLYDLPRIAVGQWSGAEMLWRLERLRT